MVQIDKIKKEIVERLKPLNPDKIILFGSYAYGEPNEDSDIDLFLIKNDLDSKNLKKFEINARHKLYKLVEKYKIGFDIIASSMDWIKNREDYFYKVDILKNGQILYEQTISN